MAATTAATGPGSALAEKPVIVWFRDDLRLADNPALSAAVEAGARLVCLYVLEEAPQVRPLGGAARWWLAGSLRALNAALRERGQALVLRRGDPRVLIPALAGALDAQAVYWNTRLDPAGAEIDRDVARAWASGGVRTQALSPDLLSSPTLWGGKPPRAFSAFLRRLEQAGAPPEPLPAPRDFPPPAAASSEALASWGLEPVAPDWAGGLRATWTPGEAAARRALIAFCDGPLRRYAEWRDRVDDPHGASRLSPHLRFGEVSGRQVWHAAHHAQGGGPAAGKFLAELAWRDFARLTLAGDGELATRNQVRSFDRFPWRDDAEQLRAWQRGRTGYPIVDAAMRQLWREGWMPNRLRMLTASFLVKHLLIDWRCGERWFWDTLVDADAANNALNWQWVAGSGRNAAPFFRIFNPELQAGRIDPHAAYVRRYVPELARLPDAHVHAPWRAPADVLARAGVVLGRDYPLPIVEHAAARARALAAFASLRG